MLRLVLRSLWTGHFWICSIRCSSLGWSSSRFPVTSFPSTLAHDTFQKASHLRGLVGAALAMYTRPMWSGLCTLVLAAQRERGERAADTQRARIGRTGCTWTDAAPQDVATTLVTYRVHLLGRCSAVARRPRGRTAPIPHRSRSPAGCPCRRLGAGQHRCVVLAEPGSPSRTNEACRGRQASTAWRLLHLLYRCLTMRFALDADGGVFALSWLPRSICCCSSDLRAAMRYVPSWSAGG